MSNLRVDFAVIGSGPAGMAAAIAAAERGLDTVLFDDQTVPGGQIYRNIEQISHDGRLDELGQEYRRGIDLTRAFRESGATYAPGSTVWQTAPDGRIGVTDRNGARVVRAKRILLATRDGATGRDAGMDHARRDGCGSRPVTTQVRGDRA